MKRIFLFASLCATILFSNCKKDADPTPQELLIGKWNVTKFITMGSNAISENATTKISAVLEFKEGGVVTFTFTNTDKTVTPPKDFSNTVTNSYSWTGDTDLTLSAKSGPDMVSVTGPATVTATSLVFTATSGDTDKFLESIEATKQ